MRSSGSRARSDADLPQRILPPPREAASEHLGFSQADVAPFVLWSRLGTPISADFVLEDGRHPTDTEWEFEAVHGHRARGLPHVLVYRKSVPPRIELTARDRERRFADFDELNRFFALSPRRAKG